MGASLWLLPPADSKVGHELYKLINETLPSLFPNVQLPHFPPHITLTSEVDITLDPSTVTSSIEVKESPNVKFAKVDVGKTFFTRVTLHLEKVDSIKNLAVECRQRYVTKGNWEEAEKWGEESFVPHLSLIYMEDIPGAETVKKIEEEVEKAGIKFDAEAWKGGRIALVNCTKPIEEWKVEGVRDL